jgi:hypothetical protein
MEADAAAVLERELVPGETVLWAGRPDPAVHFGRPDLWLVPATVLATVVFVLMAISFLGTESNPDAPEAATTNSASWAGEAILGVFVALAVAALLYALVGRFWIKARRKRHTWYYLTDRRAIEIYLGRQHRVTSAALDQLNGTHHEGGRNGHGSVVFADLTHRAASWAANLNTGFPGAANGEAGVALTFYDVPDVDVLVEVLRDRQWGRAG